MDANHVSADIFSHVYSAQRENENKIFISKKLDKPNKLLDAAKNLKINDVKYYESNTATASDAKGDITINTETVTHTINIIFEQTLLSCRNIPVFTIPTKPGIAAIRLTP